MSGKSDIVKGRIKEAVGALSDNNKLRAEGQADQAAGKAKNAAKMANNKVEEAAKDARE